MHMLLTKLYETDIGSHSWSNVYYGETPCTINIIWTSLKSTFSGLQFCRRHYGSIFIHLAIVAFQNREITRNSDKIW